MPKIKRIIEDIEKGTTQKQKKEEVSFNNLLSTGSTLLDLAISGGRVKGGGVPGGIIVEIYGPSGAGKTAILSELAASCQHNKGEVSFKDPEARLDKEYARIYQVNLTKENYSRPDTVTELFDEILSWEPKNNNVINMVAADSLAALCSVMELEGEDKMGAKRAKDFSEGLRKTARIIANNNWLIACTNQIRDDMKGGHTTPGGKGIPFYASLRIQIKPSFPKSTITKSKTIGNKKKKVDKVIGIQSVCKIVKSSVDDPFRIAPISIIFGYGIDDIRDQLQWYKDLTGGTSYDCLDKNIGIMDNAIEYIETNNMQNDLRKRTIAFWEEIESCFKKDERIRKKIR